MGISLGENQYGKAEVRLVHVAQHADRHEINDLNVSVAVFGDLAGTYLTGDNSKVLPTDSQKNTVYAFAKKYGIGEIEEFGLRLARHFVDSQPAVHRARVSVEEYAWQPVGGTGHSFARSGGEVRTAQVTCDGRAAWTVSGLRDLVLLNTAGSEFRGYVTDSYTTLPETTDRLLATSAIARWRHAAAEGNWATSYVEVRRSLVEAFTGTYSRSLQQTLYAMGRRALERCPEIAEIRLSLPNLHHVPVDLSPFGLHAGSDGGEVFSVADRPYGLIEGTVVRDDAPAPGLAW